MTSHHRAGFTAVEMVIGTVALMIMSVGIVGVTRTATVSLKTNAILHSAHGEGARGLERLQRHVRAASWATLQTTIPGFEAPQTVDDALALLGEGAAFDDLTFQAFAVDPADPNGLPVLSAPWQLGLQPSPNDPVDGADNDGNGVVDGQDLVLAPDGEQPLVLCRDVQAFTCRVAGRTLDFDLVHALRGADGGVVTHESTLSVEIRND